MDGLGRPDTVAQSRQLGRTAVLAMLRVASRCPGAVLDSTWFGYALPLAHSLPGRLAEVHGTVPLDVAQTRYQDQAPGAPAGTRLDGAFVAKHAECFLCGGAADVEVAGEPVEAGNLLTRPQFAALDPGTGSAAIAR